MTTNCASLIYATRARLTRVDACGVPLVGTCNQVVTDGIIQLQVQPQADTGNEIVQRNGHGEMCYATQPKPQLKWNNLTGSFCRVDPEMWNLITGSPLVLDDTPVTPKAAGFITRRSTYATGRFALELWSDTQGLDCLTIDDTAYPWYGYTLLPFVVNAMLTDRTYEEAGINFAFSGRTENGTGWGVGPFDVIHDNAGAPSPLLTAIPSDTHDLFEWTTLAPPASACGCQAVS